MSTFKGAALLLAGLVATATPALAHHSFAMFDQSKLTSITGTLYAVEWKNPHGWFWLKTKDKNGKEQIWGFEGSSPAAFARMGMTKADFKVGQEVKIEFYPLRDGRTGGQFLRATFPDGRVVGSLTTGIDEFREKGYIK